MTAKPDEDLRDDPQDTGDRDLAPGADPDCIYCHGQGYVTDWVDYGSTTVPMNTGCECIAE
jgi:hypothetical protein